MGCWTEDRAESEGGRRAEAESGLGEGRGGTAEQVKPATDAIEQKPRPETQQDGMALAQASRTQQTTPRPDIFSHEDSHEESSA